MTIFRAVARTVFQPGFPVLGLRFVGRMYIRRLCIATCPFLFLFVGVFQIAFSYLRMLKMSTCLIRKKRKWDSAFFHARVLSFAMSSAFIFGLSLISTRAFFQSAEQLP